MPISSYRRIRTVKDDRSAAIKEVISVKIDSYAVKSQSEWTSEKVEIQRAVSGTTRAVVGNANAPAEQTAKPGEDPAALVELSKNNEADTTRDNIQKMIDQAEADRAKLMGKLKSMTMSGVSGTPTVSTIGDLKRSMVESLLSAFFGKKMSVSLEDSFGSRLQGLSDGFMKQGEAQRVTMMQSFESTYYESEKLSYSSKGIVNTADGRTIEFDVSLNMSREFYSSVRFEQEVQFCDPIVVNFAGNAPELTGEKFDFDLDADGVMDKISFAAPGSGFLALDKNSDGKINDGKELFGPNTGNGFDELRAYDEDGNGWIDENDSVFNQLKIWSKDKDGNDQLFTLREADVGAIYLGNISTNFSMNGLDNTQNGQMRSTSIFLKESGGAGTVSHIDLTT